MLQSAPHLGEIKLIGSHYSLDILPKLIALRSLIDAASLSLFGILTDSCASLARFAAGLVTE